MRCNWRALFAGELVGTATLSQMIDTNDQGYGIGEIRVAPRSAEGVSLYGNGGEVPATQCRQANRCS